MACNSCSINGITFPDFVSNACCNPCCEETAVAGASCGCNQNSCGCNSCGCNSCGNTCGCNTCGCPNPGICPR